MTFWILKVSLNPTVSAQYVGNTLEIAQLRGFSVTNVKNGMTSSVLESQQSVLKNFLMTMYVTFAVSNNYLGVNFDYII